ncbi:MAG TPA: ABC transporter permease [Puia sp.]|nr:ABC transporter permease [Puia sp.]
MFRNYLKTAIRHLTKNKYFSVINIAGLSIGLACCMLILLYAKDELSYDRFHTQKDSIYQLTCDRIEKEGADEKFAIAAMVQGPAFKRAIPGIREFVRVNNKRAVIKKGNDVFDQDITWADENFFSVFSFPLLSGDRTRALTSPHSMVLTEETAKKYFGTADAIGKTLGVEINGRFEPFVVSAVAAPAPENSSIKFSLILPFAYLEKENPDNGWMWVSYPTFFLLDRHADLPAVERKMQEVYRIQAKPEIDMNHQAGYDTRFVWGLTPLTQMHLDTTYQGVSGASDPIYSYILSAIAAFILLIACINFVNLTIAQSLKRNKEIGIRKVVGGVRGQLIWQFLGESLTVCFASFLLAVLLAALGLPVFNHIAGKKLELSYLFDLQLLTGLVLLFMTTGVLAGFYPALVLSGLNPVHALDGRSKYGEKNYLAKGLVVLQFALATFLIIATFFISAQFNYLTSADLGYPDKDLVEFVADKAIMNKPLMELMKLEYSETPGVKKVGYCNVGKFGGKTKAGGKEFAATYERIDADYLAAMQIPLLSGRNFSMGFPSDSLNAVLVNETFAKAAGWHDPVGRTVDFLNLPGWGLRKIAVVGLVKDYHFESLTEKIRPQLFTMDPHLPLGRFLVRIDHRNIPATLHAMEKTWRGLAPDHPFQYFFKEEADRKSYEKEDRWKMIISFGALLTIFISCIGLFGLAMLSTERRSREVGIRKVLGASAGQVLRLLSGDFIKLVFIAFLIAIPAGWFAVDRWLQHFPYRIGMSWWLFGLAGMLSSGIALFTVSFHAIRASLANPVHSLRTG